MNNENLILNNKTKKFIRNKAIHFILLMFAVAIFSFILLELSPIDPVNAYLKQAVVSPEQRLILEQYWGVHQPLTTKIWGWLVNLLQGNYITLTNMSDHDVERMVQYHLEPINISFQTTNPELRCKMLHNRFAGEALKKVDKLYEGGIHMNGQIVLCKGVNDGEELERSIRDLTKYLPQLFLVVETTCQQQT